MVTTLQQQIPLGLWAVTRRDGDEQVFVEVLHDRDTRPERPMPGDGAGDGSGDGGGIDAAPQQQGADGSGPVPGSGFDVPAGTVVAWEGSLCQAMVDGAPGATADATTVPQYATTAPVRDWPVRTYLAAPILTPDGGLYGTLCGYDRRVGDPRVLAQMAPVVDLLAEMLGQVLLAQTLRESADEREAHLYRLATTDHLTGLATRAVFHDRLAHALELQAGQAGTGRPLTVLLIDVDDFKTVNDTHGHGTGDALLAHLGRTWAAQVRPGNTLARIGGDEFALLVETGMALDDVIAEISRGLATPITVPGTTMRVTASVGVAHLDPNDPTPTVTDLLARADHALYATKHAGKAGLTVHEDRRP